MCREERRIYFSNTEVIEALALFCKKNGREFPFNKSASLSIRNTPDLVIKISHGSSGENGTDFFESEVAVALILNCKNKNIPVPKAARKTLELAEGSIVFVMKINL